MSSLDLTSAQQTTPYWRLHLTRNGTGRKQTGTTSANTSRNEVTLPQTPGKPSTSTITTPTSIVQQTSSQPSFKKQQKPASQRQSPPHAPNPGGMRTSTKSDPS